MAQQGMKQGENDGGKSGQHREAGMSRAEFNAANEKLIEDQLQISEDKLFDYVPGEDK